MSSLPSMSLPPPDSLSRPEGLSDPTILARASESQLRTLWAQTQVDLRAATREVAILTAQLHRARVQAWNRSAGTSVAAREKDAEAETVDLHCAVVDARAEVACLELERDLYAFFLGD
jgi:hypothetical protein